MLDIEDEKMTSSTNIQVDEVAKLVAIVEHMMRARDNDARLDKAIDRTIEIAGQFGGRNITDFLTIYKTEMQQRDVIEEKQISSFKRVVAIGLEGRIREIQATQTTWVGFERALLAEYMLEDTSRMTRHMLMKWIEKKGKNLNALGVYNEFDQMYNRLPSTDQMFLEGDKVLYFLKAIDMNDRWELGSLLEDETQSNGLIADWVAVRRACDRFDKRRRWLDDSDMEGPIVQGWKAPIATEVSKQSESTKRAMEENDVRFEIAMDDTTKANDEHVWTSSTLVLDTLAIASSNRCKTQEMEGDKEEVKVEADAYDEEKSIVEACLIEKVNRYAAHEFEEMDKDNDLEVEVAMDNKMKEGEKYAKTSSPLFQEAWEKVDGNISVGGERAITEESCPNNIMTQEKEGGGKEAKVKDNAYDEEVKQSTMVHNEGQANRMNSKGVPRDMITSSNSKWDTSVKIKQTMVNCHTRAYHEKGGCGKHEMWSSLVLNVNMYLEHGLQGVVKVDVRTGPNKGNPMMEEGRSKCLDQGNGWNEGGTCMVYDGLCSEKAEEATTNNRGGANLERRIWWFGWTPWLWWKEWSWWHWKKRDKEPTSWFKVNLYHR